MSGRLRALATLLAVLVAISAFGISLLAPMAPLSTRVLASTFGDGSHAGLSHDEMVDVAMDIRAYTLSPEDGLLPEGYDDTVAFSPDMLSHLRDANEVIVYGLGAAGVVLVLALGLGFALARRSRQALGLALRRGGAGMLAACALIGIFGALAFDTFFTLFHDVFFPQGNWQFSSDSLLISTMPTGFWAGMAGIWGAALLVICLGLIMVGRRLGR